MCQELLPGGLTRPQSANPRYLCFEMSDLLSLKTDFKEFEKLAVNQYPALRIKAQDGWDLLCPHPQMALAGYNYFFLRGAQYPFVQVFW